MRRWTDSRAGAGTQMPQPPMPYHLRFNRHKEGFGERYSLVAAFADGASRDRCLCPVPA